MKIAPSKLQMQGHYDPSEGFTLYDDFLYSAITDVDLWLPEVEADGTAQSTVAIDAGEHGGVLLGTCGAVANDFALVSSELVFNTTYSMYCETYFTPAASPDCFAFGFSDAQTESNGALVTNATTASGALVPTDAALFVAESANNSTMKLMAGIAKAGTDVVSELNTIYTLTNSTAVKLGIEINADRRVKFYVDNALLFETADEAVTTNIAMGVILAMSNVAGTIVPTWSADWISVFNARV